ncbi:MAG: hypothetical protein KDB14_23330 [Planctomycetales bacterium]|nr:hypothetical protein [Planctomycetales bacterium]
MRPHLADSRSEMELLAEYTKEDIGPTVAMEDEFERLRKDTAELKRRLDDVDTMLSARNAELMQTRAQHERALKEISMMRLELEQWRDSLFALQTRLEKQERERIDVLDELARRVEEIQSDVSARRP